MNCLSVSLTYAMEQVCRYSLGLYVPTQSDQMLDTSVERELVYRLPTLAGTLIVKVGTHVCSSM